VGNPRVKGRRKEAGKSSFSSFLLFFREVFVKFLLRSVDRREASALSRFTVRLLFFFIFSQESDSFASFRQKVRFDAVARGGQDGTSTRFTVRPCFLLSFLTETPVNPPLFLRKMGNCRKEEKLTESNIPTPRKSVLRPFSTFLKRPLILPLTHADVRNNTFLRGLTLVFP